VGAAAGAGVGIAERYSLHEHAPSGARESDERVEYELPPTGW
jgi:hypothetical protein